MANIMAKRINMINFKLNQAPEQIGLTDKGITDEDLQYICLRIDSKIIKEIQMRNQKRRPNILTYKATLDFSLYNRDNLTAIHLVEHFLIKAITISAIKHESMYLVKMHMPNLGKTCLGTINLINVTIISGCRDNKFIQDTIEVTKGPYDIFYSVESARKLDQSWCIQHPNEVQFEELTIILYVQMFDYTARDGLVNNVMFCEFPLKAIPISQHQHTILSIYELILQDIIISLLQQYLAKSHQTIKGKQIRSNLGAKFPTLEIHN